MTRQGFAIPAVLTFASALGQCVWDSSYLLSHYNELSLLHSKGAGVFSQSFGSPSFCPSFCHI